MREDMKRKAREYGGLSGICLRRRRNIFDGSICIYSSSKRLEDVNRGVKTLD